MRSEIFIQSKNENFVCGGGGGILVVTITHLEFSKKNKLHTFFLYIINYTVSTWLPTY
jgi:hypothetical protein